MNSFLIEAEGGGTGRFRIVVIQAGLSVNLNYYSDALLREAAPLFDGVRVFVKSDREHLAGGGKDFRNLIGGLSEPHFIEERTPEAGRIEAVLTLLDPAGPEAVKLTEAVKSRQTALFGFSINADGTVTTGTVAGKRALIATKFTKIRSVDLIVEPGAGGQVIGLVEAKGQNMDEIVISEAAAHDIVKARNLPLAAAKRLMAKFRAGDDKTEAGLRESIADAAAYTTPADTGAVRLGDFPRIEVGETRADKAATMLDAFFDRSHRDHHHARSFKECYVAVTGDKRVSGRLQDADLSLMRDTLMATTALRESLDSASWANALGDSVTRRMIQLYRLDDIYSVWRKFCKIATAIDFRTQERFRVGGYGNLPGVTQGAPYLSLASPSDEKATYTISKRGGTEDVTIEMIRNDDVNAIREVPNKLTMAAKKTLSEFAGDFVRNNAAIYDALAWFHATHGNLSTAALDAAGFAAARLLMLKQTEKDSGKRLGIPPSVLLVPWDLQETAFNLFQRATENDKKFIATVTPDIVPMWYWADTTDWALFADPEMAPALELGFLDGNEEPELFVQDNPTVGSMFSNDKLVYKIRHIYGGAVVDFRPAVKSVQ